MIIERWRAALRFKCPQLQQESYLAGSSQFTHKPTRVGLSAVKDRPAEG
jgi:hypothetical protein